MTLAKRLIRVSEAAEILSLGRSKAYEMAASGELPTIKVGRSIRVPVEALDPWIHERVSAREKGATFGEVTPWEPGRGAVRTPTPSR